MTESEYIAAAESRRKRRERELLLALLLLITRGINDAILIWRHNGDYRTALSNRILGNPSMGMKGAIPGTTTYLASAHQSGFRLANERIEGTIYRSYEDLKAVYTSEATALSTAIVAALSDAFMRGIMDGDTFRNTVKAIRDEIETAGYAVDNPYAISVGVERQIVSAFNNGIADRAFGSDDVTGFRHFTVMDGRETDICHSRNLLTLPIDHPYWLGNWPSLHYGCRSVVDVVRGEHAWSTSFPTIPPQAGFGAMPIGVMAMIRGSVSYG